jgi:hypothetical protein
VQIVKGTWNEGRFRGRVTMDSDIRRAVRSSVEAGHSFLEGVDDCEGWLNIVKVFG